MSSQGVSTSADYLAYNTVSGAYVTGDVANHTLRLVKDGVEATPTNSPVEVDSTNLPGHYRLTLTAAETQFGTVVIGGKSSTTNVIIIPITLTFEDNTAMRTNTAQAGGTNTITLDTGASAVNGTYTNTTIFIRSGTGAGQTNLITAYNGTTKVATVATPWATVPDATSVFSIQAFGPGAIISLASNIKKNAASAGFPFVMTNPNSTPPNSPFAGLTVSGLVSIDGAPFQNLTNSVVEIGQGAYQVNLAAPDTNGNHLLFMFTAVSANTLFLAVITQP